MHITTNTLTIVHITTNVHTNAYNTNAHTNAYNY